MKTPVCQIAIETPLRRLFDYHPVPGAVPGARVRVPFGRQHLVGIVVSHMSHSDVPAEKLRSIEAVLDPAPLFSAADLKLLQWAAEYYHHPVGEVFATALPRLLRQGRDVAPVRRSWRITDAGRAALAQGALQRAHRQQQLLGHIATTGECDESALEAAVPGWRPLARALRDKSLLEFHEQSLTSAASGGTQPVETGPVLTGAQLAAVETLTAPGLAGAFLLDGVTGSGKTEVYLRAAGAVLARGGAVLVMCPEIGLTPQLLERFEKRFEVPIAALHSGLTDGARARAWHLAATGGARIVVGTRSAVFTPIPDLGLIIVDEEHDASYKQQEGGFRYSARDLALLRAQQRGVPVVLGSATPSLESLHNVTLGRLTHIELPERAGSATPPRIALIDMRAHPVNKGIATPLRHAIQRHLDAGAQVLLFINRRGYAPTLLCQSCGWVAPCNSCDARLTVHLARGARASGALACHHCGAEAPRPERCPRCGYELHPLGHGTERVEETLAEFFPGHAVERFDRDSLRAPQQLHAAIDRVHSGSARILVGTQMLTKGHHFPDVTLVGVLNADQSLFSTDFRAAERLAQTIVQVAGRAGRADRPGEVLIQSQYPDHPLLKTLLDSGYAGFAADALQEREAARWPPFSRLALLRASDTQPEVALKFLRAARQLATPAAGVALLGPVPAAMVRRADRYYAQLMVESSQRTRLQAFLAGWVPAVEQLEKPRSLRWVLDVDPLEVL
ncbi:MAG: primosomal protein N' [Proteobacteria bacterium]|nr:primosomal protein N' [Pseudomonadota bacterium]